MRASSLFAWRILLWCGALLAGGCVDPYMPDVLSSPERLLVVDGFLNATGPTVIHLSRTYDVATKGAVPTETGATLYIEDEGGQRFALPEGSVKGTYTSAELTLNTARKYRLHIRTAAGGEYASDFVPVQATPPIDNVTWRTTDSGVSVYVSTHDENNATRYYRWEYEETWEIQPLLVPELEFRNGYLRPITVPYPELCWRSASSTAINLGTTLGLTQDVVSEHPLHTIAISSDRLYRKYSLLARQHALTREEYAYWEQLEKNTENLGTLFDPLPAQLTGNVRCLSDAQEPVLGYVGAHSVQERRLFLTNAELPRSWRFSSGYEMCVPPDTVLGLKAVRNTFSGGYYVPLAPIPPEEAGVIVNATFSAPDCVDCRTRGTAIRPAFWQ